jgi:phenylalanyl-tRNA synthetase alpha chain
MEYQDKEITKAADVLKQRLKTLDDKRSILRAPELSALYERLKNLPSGTKRASFGKQVNQLKAELEKLAAQSSAENSNELGPIDVTAPFDANVPPDQRPNLLPAKDGSVHPLNQEITQVLDIFYRMGFYAEASREIDDDYHMFTSLNFPPDHPARDDYDTFMTEDGLIAPAHTSTMQNRVMKKYKKDLEAGKGIRVVIPGRVFRNEDLDARHEHTFYQLEGVYVDEGINTGHLVATIKTWLSTYFHKDIKIKIQPFYFPFTEPSFEFAAGCPFCDQKGCSVCSYSGWIELGGCGMIHPNVLKEADIDPAKYSGFAWGFGIDRLVMLKYDIEDVRHFQSGNLKFLRQF